MHLSFPGMDIETIAGDLMKADLSLMVQEIQGNIYLLSCLILTFIRNGWGATIVDSLDTLYIMGLRKEFDEAKEFVRNINWTLTEEPVQLFETVIRYVGGLLSAYDLSNDLVFIEKAVELTELLIPAFDSPTGVPYQYMDFKT